MKCSNCGREINEFTTLCSYCGQGESNGGFRLQQALIEEFGTDRVNSFARSIMTEIVVDDSLDAMERLAWMEARGLDYEDDDDLKDIPRDVLKASRWFEIVADRTNSAEMHFWCANGYMFGPNASAENVQVGIRHMEAAANLDWARAHYKLGVIYEEGRLVPEDDWNAALHYEKAAILGDADAMHMYSSCLVNGKGVPEDTDAAVYWNWRFVKESDKAIDYTPTDGMRELAAKYERNQSRTTDSIGRPQATRTLTVHRKSKMISGTAIVYYLYVDGEYLANIYNGKTVQVEVSTDTHDVYFDPVINETYMTGGPRRSQVFQIEASSSDIEFEIDTKGGGRFTRVK